MPVPNLKVRITAISLFAAVAVAGCGGGSSTTSNSADFVSQGNAFCKQNNAEVAAIPKPGGKADIATYIDKTVPLVSDTFSQLKALTPPADQQKTYDAWIAGIQTRLSLIEQAQKVADGGNPDKAISLIGQTQAQNDQSHSLAKKLGLTECAKNATAGSSGSSGSSG